MPPDSEDEYTGSQRRGGDRRDAGDSPFGPEEALFGWVPRAGAGAVLLLAVLLLVFAWRHHDEYRLIPHEQGATLERGVFAPWGWDAWTPEGGAEAWAPVPWSLGEDAPGLEGELGDLADVFADLLTQRVEAVLGDDDAVAVASARVESFAAWYATKFGQEPEPTARARTLLKASVDQARSAAETEAAAVAASDEAQRQEILSQEVAATEREREVARVRSHNAGRRSLLLRVEEFLAGLPPAGQGSPQEEADRVSIEIFVHAMDTPLAAPAADPGETP